MGEMITMAQTWEIALLLDQVPHRSFTQGSSGPKSQVGFAKFTIRLLLFPGVLKSCPFLLYPCKGALQKSLSLCVKEAQCILEQE